MMLSLNLLPKPNSSNLDKQFGSISIDLIILFLEAFTIIFLLIVFFLWLICYFCKASGIVELNKMLREAKQLDKEIQDAGRRRKTKREPDTTTARKAG